MHLQTPHKFSKTEAVERVKKALDEGRSKIAGQAEIKEERWEGDILNFKVALQGSEITGALEVKDKEFVLDATLPLLWRMFEGRIEKAIADQVKTLL